MVVQLINRFGEVFMMLSGIATGAAPYENVLV